MALSLPSSFASQELYSTYYLALADDYDPVKAGMTAFEEAEMDAAMALVPRASITKLFAVDSGDWNTAGNWYPSGVPGAGTKWCIGEGCVCTYDKDDDTTATLWGRVDGTLKGDVTVDTALVFETMVITPLGNFIDGSRPKPVANDVVHQWIIDTSGGEIDADPAGYDTFFQSRGIISIGQSDVWGYYKTPYLQASVYSAPNAGATSLVLEEAPTNWAIGDKVVICSTRCQGPSWGGIGETVLLPDEELVTLTSVSGATIGWTGGLTNDHRGFAATATRPELKCHVINLTRNVKFRPSDDTVFDTQRGHMMQMHNPAGWSMRNAEVADLGRTAKMGPNYYSRIYFSSASTTADVALNLSASPYWVTDKIDTGFAFLISYWFNASGSGSFTIVGTDEFGGAQSDTINYNAGVNGFTMHPDYWGTISSITFTTAFSSGYPQIWIDAQSRQMNQNGVRDMNTGKTEVGSTYTDVHPRANIQGRYPFHWHKLGVTGDILDAPPVLDGCSFHGSPGWLVAQHVTHGNIINCVGYDAVGAGLVQEDGNETGLWQDCVFAGFVGNNDYTFKRHEDEYNIDPARTGTPYWFTGRGMKASGLVAIGGLGGFVYNTRLTLNAQSMALSQMDQPTAFRGIDPVHTEDATIHFIDCTAVACYYGLVVIRSDPDQNNDLRTSIKNYAAWSCSVGFFLTYTQHYSMMDNNFYGGNVDSSLGVSGGRSAEGLDVGLTSSDMVFINPVVEKAAIGIVLAKGNANLPGIYPDGFQGNPLGAYYVVNPTFTNVADEYSGDAAYDVFLDTEDLTSVTPSLTASVDFVSGIIWHITGTKTDELGEVAYPFGQDVFNYGLNGTATIANMLTLYGYYTEGATKWLMSDEWFSSRLTGEAYKIILPIDVSGENLTGKTNHGATDLSNNTPPVLADFTVELVRNTNKNVDVVARATGNGVMFGGKTVPVKTHIIEESDGTITLVPLADQNYSETCFVWVDDVNGNTTRATMTINVNKRALYLGRADLLST